MQELIYVNGMKPGHGINILTGDNLSNIAVSGNFTPIEFAKGQNVKTQLIRIDDISSLHKSLGVEVTASGSFMGFSANAKVDFANECNFNSHSTYLMIHVEVTNAFMSMDDPLKPDAEELLRTKQPDRFRERFGDVFIAGISTGGEYFAVYQISGTDEHEKEQVSIAINASYQALIASAALGVKINSMTESSKSHLEVSTFTFQLGGANTMADQTPEQIMTKAHNFAPSVCGEFSVPYSMLPASYRSLKLPDDGCDLIEIEHQRQALADAWKLRTELISLNNDIEYILLSDARNYDEFEPFDAVALTAVRHSLAAQIDANFKGASACMKDAKQCKFADVDTSAIKLPKRKPGSIAPKTVPEFVGLTLYAAAALAAQVGIDIQEYRASDFDDPHGATSARALEAGYYGHPHSQDQIIVTWQQQPPGSILKPGASVFLDCDLAPGVAP